MRSSEWESVRHKTESPVGRLAEGEDGGPKSLVEEPPPGHMQTKGEALSLSKTLQQSKSLRTQEKGFYLVVCLESHCTTTCSSAP